MSKKVLVSLSGGMDSVTVLGRAIYEGHRVEAIGFLYGSKHNKYENAAARDVAEYYNIPFILMDLSPVFKGLESNLLLTGGDIPEGHYEAENMRQTVVPGRNGIFTSILAAIAESRKLDEIWLGIHSGDHTIYPDCRPEWYMAMRKAVEVATDGATTLYAPYLEGNKTTIIADGETFNVPYHLTRTCYKDQPLACGKCGACQERLEAFAANNLWDPVRYEY